MRVQIVGLGIAGNAQDGWTVSVGRPGMPPAQGYAGPGALEAVRDAAHPLLVSAPHRDDTDWRRLEARAARMMASLVDLAGPAGRAWLRATGRAEGRAEPLVVVVDVPESLQDIPWELLATTPDGPPMEATGQGVVVRILGGMPAPPARDDLVSEMVLCRMGETDEAGSVALAVHAACEAKRVAGPRAMPSSAPTQRVVTVVADAERRGLVGQMLTPGRYHSGPVERALTQAEVAWIGVVGGHDRLEDTVRTLPGRILATGAAAVFDADRRLDPGSAATFVRGLHEALLGGEPVVGGLVRGRALVRARQDPDPGARWWRHRLWIGHLVALLRVPFPRSLGVRGWASPAPCADDLLRRASVYAEADGFLGFEQIADALVDHSPRGLESFREVLSHRLHGWHQRLAGLARVEVTGPSIRPTPRVDRALRTMHDGFTAEELFHVLIESPWGWARWLDQPSAPAPTAAHASGFEVLGGPEDGLRIRLEEGGIVGRFSPSSRAEIALYTGSCRTDPKLSRQHLRWLGGGWAHFLSPGRGVQRGADRVVRPHGQVELFNGDLVELTPHTWLVGIDSLVATRTLVSSP